ncbi:hypothetical protein H4R18_002289 [Coemansia javaensis]|uniref:RGS domain-containing protein n=1 Tax=Coemansia javaensis TaxID=2761396 RepID=A0A9W8LJD5_9FUNG|nr:hypothetical protein H4R18_002289 [Coemansia javaensis]
MGEQQRQLGAAGAGRARAESDGFTADTGRSSDERVAVSTFFEGQAWQRMSGALPTAVQDPLNIDELEREERLMPFTEVAVGEMGQRLAGHSRATSDNPRATQLASTASGNGEIDWAYMQDHNLRTGGLPSLDQVLTRRTRAPLALRDFAVHCSVRQPQARRWLEFYMAARTHEKMCLAYESDLRHAKARSHYGGSAVDDGDNDDDDADEMHEDRGSAQREAAHAATMESLAGSADHVRPLSDLQGGGAAPFRRSRRQSSRMALQIQTAAETIFMRYFRAALDPSLNQGVGGHWHTASSAAAATAASATDRGATGSGGGGGRGLHERGKIGSLKRMLTQRAAGRPGTAGHAALDDPYHQGYGVTDSVVYDGGAGGAEKEPRHLGSTLSLAASREYLTTPITAGQSDYLAQLRQGTSRGLGGAFGSGRHHLYYHMPWPPEILTDIEQKLVRDGAALDHALFSEALLYAYDVLDTYYFPIFVADAVSRNVTRDHCVVRVFVAFALLWFGFALPVALILLNHSPRAERAWSLVPLLLGWWNMAVGFGGCDPLLAVMRKYQSPAVKDHQAPVPRSRQQRGQSASSVSRGCSLRGRIDQWHRAWFSTRVSVDMTATRMVRARSIRWFLGALVMTAVSTAILCAVPGTHIYTGHRR